LIFVSLGTHEQPFPRAIALVRPLAQTDEVVVQHGYTPPLESEPGFRWIEFLPYEEIVSLMTEADVVVCHGGVGTIMTALHARVVPVVIPRLQRFNEHVDDHQLQIARALGVKGLLQPVLEADDVAPAVACAAGAPRQSLRAPTALRDAIADAAGVNNGHRPGGQGGLYPSSSSVLRSDR